MSEESVELKKHYLLMMDDVGMAMLSRLAPSISFVEVVGMTLDGNPGFQALVSPIVSPPCVIEDHNPDATKMVDEDAKDDK